MSLLLFLPFTGCHAIGAWFDDVGEHMPVAGERCEHWQCFTESGRRQSALNKQERLKQERLKQEQMPRQSPACAPPPSSPPLPEALPEKLPPGATP